MSVPKEQWHFGMAETIEGIDPAHMKYFWVSNDDFCRATDRIMAHAKRFGWLSKPDCCAECGCKETRRFVAHHDNYWYPLKIRWMCSPCHIRWHKFHIAVYQLTRTGPGNCKVRFSYRTMNLKVLN